MAPQQALRTCTCGAQFAPDANFCQKCGTKNPYPREPSPARDVTKPSADAQSSSDDESSSEDASQLAAVAQSRAVPPPPPPPCKSNDEVAKSSTMAAPPDAVEDKPAVDTSDHQSVEPVKVSEPAMVPEIHAVPPPPPLTTDCDSMQSCDMPLPCTGPQGGALQPSPETESVTQEALGALPPSEKTPQCATRDAEVELSKQADESVAPEKEGPASRPSPLGTGEETSTVIKPSEVATPEHAALPQLPSPQKGAVEHAGGPRCALPPPPPPAVSGERRSRSRSAASSPSAGRRSSASRGGGRRSRSRTPARGRRGVSRWSQENAYAKENPKRGAMTKTCWHGRNCTRPRCWFIHPEGRRIDEERAAEGRRAWRRANTTERRAQRSSSRSRPARRSSPKRREEYRSQPSPSSRSSSPEVRSRSRSAQGRTLAVKSPGREQDLAQSPTKGTTDSSAPATTFRSYVLSECGQNVTADEAIARWAEHQKNLAGQSFESLRGTKLFYDLYHPRSALRLFNFRAEKVIQAAEAFIQDIARGRFEDLSLRVPQASGGGRKGATCPTAGHMKAPQFAFDPNVDTVVLSGIPSSVSVWDACDVLLRSSGLVALCWTRPCPGAGKLARDLRAQFDSAASAKAALAALADAKLGEDPVRAVNLALPAAKLDALVVPPEMARPERLSRDAELSAQCVQRLNQLCDVRPEVTEAVLGHGQGMTEKKLDLQVLYLRRVHNFCFYAGAWHSHTWEVRDSCGAAILRDHNSDGLDSADEGEWARAHDQRLAKFLESVKLEKPLVPSGEETLIAKQFSELCEQNTRKKGEGKFQCAQCSKLFKGIPYVHKHLRKAHPALIDELPANRHAYEEAAKQAYFADPKKPLTAPLRILRAVSAGA